MTVNDEDLFRPMSAEERRKAEEADLVNATALRLGLKLPLWQAEIIAKQIAARGPMSKLGAEALRIMQAGEEPDG